MSDAFCTSRLSASFSCAVTFIAMGSLYTPTPGASVTPAWPLKLSDVIVPVRTSALLPAMPMLAPENVTGASPMVFSIFTRTPVPEMLGINICRTVRPLIFGAATRALCDIAQAEYQPLAVYPVCCDCIAQPVSASMLMVSVAALILENFMAHSNVVGEESCHISMCAPMQRCAQPFGHRLSI